MTSLDDYALQKLAAATQRGLRRTLDETASEPAQRVSRDARPLVNFCGNDYLGLSQHPALKRAAARAAEEHGTGAGASRLVTGNHPLYAKLEKALAKLKGTDAALVFGSGYLANVGTIPALVGEGDLILADELSHSCLITGARLSGARVALFRHNDMRHLEALLKSERAAAKNCLILTEGVFSMDGDLAPLPEIVRLAKAHDAWTMTDDAHGLGVIGEGRGSAAHWGIAPDVQMGTLSKSAGAYGGYVCASRPVIDLLVNRARSLIYATGLPPAVIAAAHEGLAIIARDKELCAKPVANARLFAMLVGLPEPQSSIVPVILGDAGSALNASRMLFDEGFLVTAIRPPTVPDGTARLRITFAADHSEADIRRLAGIVRTRLIHKPLG